nr:MAG TPA: hypothetical protein [Bacteriophage sp.]
MTGRYFPTQETVQNGKFSCLVIATRKAEP